MMPSDLYPTSTMTSDSVTLRTVPLDDLTFRDVAEAAIVEVKKLGIFSRVGVELVTGIR